MATVYMDESGDLGFSFSKGSSKYFLVTFLFLEDIRPVRNLVKSTFRTIKKQHKHKSGVLHAYNESPQTRKRLLRKLNRTDAKVMCIYLDKTNVYTHLKNEKNILYNYITNILLDRIHRRKYINTDNLSLIVERKDTNKFLNENFSDYLTNQSNRNHKNDISVEIMTPHQDKCLQATDFASWALFRKYEYSDTEYSDLIQNLVIEENELFG